MYQRGNWRFCDSLSFPLSPSPSLSLSLSRWWFYYSSSFLFLSCSHRLLGALEQTDKQNSSINTHTRPCAYTRTHWTGKHARKQTHVPPPPVSFSKIILFINLKELAFGPFQSLLCRKRTAYAPLSNIRKGVSREKIKMKTRGFYVKCTADSIFSLHPLALVTTCGTQL